jgi:hypothetical protein
MTNTEIYISDVHEALRIESMIHPIQHIEMSDKGSHYANLHALRIMSTEQVIRNGYLDAK